MSLPAYSPSLARKHDYQLAEEMDAIFKNVGLECRSTFERKRSRVSLTISDGRTQEAINLLMSEHPTFMFSYENPSIRGTRFLIFVEKWV